MTQVQTNEVKEVVISKAQKALLIFKEELEKGEEKHRARTIKRFKDELGMGDAGASTYYQNTKKINGGGKVKHYYKPKSKSTEPQDDGEETFGVQLKDGSLKVFKSQQELDEWKAVDANAELVADEQQVDETEEQPAE